MTRLGFKIIDQPPVKRFLDAVDQVLNSNTFLLSFHGQEDNLAESFQKFIECDFMDQLILQDAHRDWDNYWYYGQDDAKNAYKKEQVVRHQFNGSIQRMQPEHRLAYLEDMLTTKSIMHHFKSPHQRSIPEYIAAEIVHNFIEAIMSGRPWRLFQVTPNFCYTLLEQEEDPDIIGYFGGNGFGDSASILLRDDNKAYLLLTNGTP